MKIVLTQRGRDNSRKVISGKVDTDYIEKTENPYFISYILSLLNSRLSETYRLSLLDKDTVLKVRNDILNKYLIPLSASILKLRNVVTEALLHTSSQTRDNITYYYTELFNLKDGYFFNNVNKSLNFIKKICNKYLRKKYIYNNLKKKYIKLKEVSWKSMFELNSSGPIKLKRNDSAQSSYLSSYKVGPYIVEVIDIAEPENIYFVRIPEYESIIRRGIINDLSIIIRKLAPPKVLSMSFENLVKYLKLLSERLYRCRFPELVKFNISISHEIVCFRSIRMLKFMPFLLDNLIDEFYIDSPETHIYLDHSKYGRCLSNIIVHKYDIDAFIVHLRIDTGIKLDNDSPSAKTDFLTSLFRVRVSIDGPPLAIKGPSIDVRKFRKQFYTLYDLVAMKTLSLDAAAFILLLSFFRRNIIIAGPPGSGKTTLLNAIDYSLPKYYRRIYIEDVQESLDLLPYGYHQVKLKVDPFEVKVKTRRKSIEVIKLLHRKPDYVILGELQTREHVIAAFHSMISGIRCIQTIHADNIENLVYRLTCLYKIPTELINCIDLIVLMKRTLYPKERRFVDRISTIKYISGNIIIMDIFRRNLNTLFAVDNIERLEILNKICEDEKICKEDILKLYNTLKENILKIK